MKLAYGDEVVKPYSKYVLKQLAIPLDDNKRLVRTSAANCKNIWEISLSN